MFETIRVLSLDPREKTYNPAERSIHLTDSFLNELEAVRQTFSDIAQTDVAYKVFASPKWIMRVLGAFHPFLLTRKKIPFAAFFSDNWIHYPEKVLSVAQAAVLEFVHESQTVISDKVSLLNVADLYEQRLANLIYQEKELHEIGHGPIATTLQQTITIVQIHNPPRNIRQTLAEMEFFIPDDTGTLQPSNFSQLLLPVFAIDSIRSRVNDILADDLALACGDSAVI